MHNLQVSLCKLLKASAGILTSLDEKLLPVPVSSALQEMQLDKAHLAQLFVGNAEWCRNLGSQCASEALQQVFGNIFDHLPTMARFGDAMATTMYTHLTTAVSRTYQSAVDDLKTLLPTEHALRSHESYDLNFYTFV